MSDNDIIQDFLIESAENLDRLDRDLVGLEKNPEDKNAMAGVFRTIHTIKGTCGFLGFSKLEKVAHVGESLLTRLRDGQLKLTPEITTALLTMVDAVRQILREIQSTGQDGESDYPELRERLSQLLNGTSPAGSSPAATLVPMAAVSSASTALPSQAETNPKPPSPPPPAASAAQPAEAITPVHGPTHDADFAHTPEEPDPADHHGLPRTEEVAATLPPNDARPREVASETIRVAVNLLDKLMTLVGELVLARNQLLQVTNATGNPALNAVSQRMNLIATELQEEVMKTRMQPIGNIWAQFPRTVRDVALGCCKQVKIEMEGKETELDKTIIEAIKDPLTHLVRNSVDHGIELPEDRVRAGKDITGCLRLRAFHEGGQVNIEISDDGAGLNRERIRQKAVERGLVTPEQGARLSEREIFNLIFLPGFSTAQKVTTVSGRGVGMDVVKTNVEKIGGVIDVQSTAGQGTTVRVKIPLTLAIIPALVVTCGGDRYAIPQVSLLELVRLEAEQAHTGIELVHGVPVYRLRGRLLPLVYLKHELHLAEAPADAAKRDQAVNIVVLQADEHQFGLVVDSILDTEEIVVKPLRKQLKTVKTFAGSSIMGDGKVALILDVLGLAQRASVVSETHDRALTEKPVEPAGSRGEKQTFLLFAGQDDSRMAIPLSALARLEEFPVAQVETSGRQWVTQYRGQILPLIRLNAVMAERRLQPRGAPALPASDAGPLQVLVLNHQSRSFGLVVDRILDIVEDWAEIQLPPTRPSVLYSVVIGERVTELLDIPALLQADAARASQPPIAGQHAAKGAQ